MGLDSYSSSVSVNSPMVALVGRARSMEQRIATIRMGNSWNRLHSHLGISAKMTSQVSLLIVSNFINNGVAFLTNIFVARTFGTEIFGLFSLTVTLMTTTLTLSEFGMNLTMVRFFKMHLAAEEQKRAVVLANLYFKLLIFIVLFLGAGLLSVPLARLFGKGDVPSFLVGLAITGGGFLGFLSFAKAFLQSLERFTAIAWLTASYAILRIIFLGGVLAGDKTTVLWLIISLYLMPVAILLLICAKSFWTWLGKKRLKGENLWEMLKQCVGYSKWIAFAGIAHILFRQSLVFVVAASTNIQQVAILNAGLVFTTVFSVIGESGIQVLFPKVSELKVKEMPAYKRKIRRVLPTYFVLTLSILVVLSLIMKFVLGHTYEKSLPIFWITGVGAVVSAGMNFYSLLIHSMNRPDIQAYVSCFTLLIFTMAGAWVAAHFGMLAVVTLHVAILFLGGLAKVVWIERNTVRLREN